MILNIGILITVLSQLLYIDATSTDSVTTYPTHFPLPDLPSNHLVRYLNSFPDLKKHCLLAPENCQLPRNETLPPNLAESTACWGHEPNCSATDRFQTPTCTGKTTGRLRSKAVQVGTFFKQADFGYVKQQIDEMHTMCRPKRHAGSSSLVCSKYLRTCRGRNLLFDFRELFKRKELIRYHMDVLRRGQILGNCILDRKRFEEEMDHMSALQSWAPELRYMDETSKQHVPSFL